MIKPAIVLSLLFSASVFAQPQVASVTPSSGPVAGESTVTIRGSGFDTTCTPDLLVCGKPAVTFGSLPALSFRIIDSQTIEAVTPSELPGGVAVVVTMPRGAGQLSNGFTFTGEASDAFERVLLPIFLPPVTSSGLQFETFFSMWNTAGSDIPVFAFNGKPVIMKARLGSPLTIANPDGNPGRLIYIPKGSFDRIAASLRVAETSRAEDTAGTRIPVVPERDFRSDVIVLLDVPGSETFRYSLRIYSLDPATTVFVKYIDSDRTVLLRQDVVALFDPADIYHPGYAQVTNMHPKNPFRIEIEPTNPKRIWAFVSVTNNVTQEITVVAPH